MVWCIPDVSVFDVIIRETLYDRVGSQLRDVAATLRPTLPKDGEGSSWGSTRSFFLVAFGAQASAGVALAGCPWRGATRLMFSTATSRMNIRGSETVFILRRDVPLGFPSESWRRSFLGETASFDGTWGCWHSGHPFMHAVRAPPWEGGFVLIHRPALALEIMGTSREGTEQSRLP